MIIKITDEQVDRGPRYSMMRRFFATARERHNIYERRKNNSRPPWTDDLIFQKYRFCNPDRELDKVTVWLRENWREPYADHQNLAFAMALARLINWPPTLEEIGFPEKWDPNRMVRIIKKRQERGEKIYTGAYLLGAIPKGAVKAEYLAHEVFTPLYTRLLTHTLDDTLEKVWVWFQEQPGIGPFLSYEIVTDLRHTRYLNKAPDIMTWANAGPGALRGLIRMWGYQPPRKTRKKRIPGFSFPKHRANECMQLLLKKSEDYLPTEMLPWEMRHIEMWLCEHDKRERIRLGQGVLEKFIPMEPNQWVREKSIGLV